MALIDKPRARTVDFGGRYVKVFPQGIHLPQLVVQPDVCHDIGLVPVVGVLPTFSNHGLSREVYDVRGLEVFDLVDDFVGMVVQVQLAKLKAVPYSTCRGGGKPCFPAND